MSETRKEFYTIKELAELLGVSVRTLERVLKRGELPYYVIGRSKRFRHADVEAYLAKVRKEGKQETPPSR